jgi:hypothetical protein
MASLAESVEFSAERCDDDGEGGFLNSSSCLLADIFIMEFFLSFSLFFSLRR